MKRRPGFVAGLAFAAFAALASPATACPTVEGYVHDTFASRDDAWTHDVVKSGGGVLDFPLKANTVAWAVNHVDYHHGDGTVCADVRIDAAHAPEEEAGIAFWMVFAGKTPSFYTFTVSPAGRVTVANRAANGAYRTLLRKPEAAVRKAAGQTDELIASERNGQVHLTLNGTAIGTILSRAPGSAWYAGVFAISPDKKPADWRFTQFSLTP